MKKLVTLLLALVLLLTMAAPALAEDTYTITINNSTAGHTYEAYQIFSGRLDVVNGNKILSDIVWGNGVDQTKAVNGKTLSQVFDGKTAEEIAETLKTEEDAKTFAQKVAPYLTNPTTSGAQEDGKYAISGLTAGYYLVKDKDGSVPEESSFYTNYIMQVVGDVTAIPKGDKPTLDKEIQKDGNWGNVGGNQIGDTVNFRTVSTVPNTTGYTTYTYIIHDTMSEGLTSNVKSAADVTIKVNNTDVLDAAYYTVNVDTANANKFSVSIDIMKAIADGKIATSDKLYTYYSGVLNENAKVYDEGKQYNAAHLEYSNNPNDDTNKGKTPDEKVYDWTFKMGVNKVDDKGTSLTGAKFVLSRNGALTVENMKCDDNGAPTVTTDLIGLVKVSDGVYRVAKAGDTDVVYTVDAGTPVIKGLDDNVDYYLYETKSPSGYNLLKAPVHFVIDAKYSEDGSTIAVGYPTVTVDSGEPSTTLSTNVVNKSGSTLPSTGGMGTTLFYVVGGLLVAVAVVLLVTKKKMSADK